ncbi:hypothetical protein ACFVT1_14745 [Streptomyces sp. NPDC057963]|uniref:hypothetical protein n=1 Tax=Streptomyces sp. NPDC057963 TaxID=3346290 RepID=UPI0036EF22A0
MRDPATGTIGVDGPQDGRGERGARPERTGCVVGERPAPARFPPSAPHRPPLRRGELHVGRTAPIPALPEAADA